VVREDKITITIDSNICWGAVGECHYYYLWDIVRCSLTMKWGHSRVDSVEEERAVGGLSRMFWSQEQEEWADWLWVVEMEDMGEVEHGSGITVGAVRGERWVNDAS